MVDLTVQVSQAVAERLEPARDRLPALLQQIAQALPSDAVLADLSLNLGQSPTASPAYIEVLDFLITSPSPRELLAFKVSPATQNRLGDLLEKNREEGLTELEQAELDAFEQIEHVMILLKARARRLLS
jgi:hypothetical protein